MRMWGVDPRLLCDRHLRGEHVETHMFLGTLRKGRSLKGYIDRGLVEVSRIAERHDRLAVEMVSRGDRHASPLEPEFPLPVAGEIDQEESLRELSRRCEECRRRIEARRSCAPSFT